MLLKQTKKNKWTTAYEPNFYKIYRIDGSSIAARRQMDGREVYRDAVKFKLANSVINDEHDITENNLEEENTTDDWREELLKNNEPGNEGNQDSIEEGKMNSEEHQMSRTTPIQETPMKRRKTQMTTAKLTPNAKPPPRESTRERKKPSYLNDYVTY